MCHESTEQNGFNKEVWDQQNSRTETPEILNIWFIWAHYEESGNKLRGKIEITGSNPIFQCFAVNFLELPVHPRHLEICCFLY